MEKQSALRQCITDPSSETGTCAGRIHAARLGTASAVKPPGAGLAPVMLYASWAEVVGEPALPEFEEDDED